MRYGSALMTLLLVSFIVVPGASALDLDMDSTPDNPLPKISGVEGGPEGIESYLTGIGQNIGSSGQIASFIEETEQFKSILNTAERGGVGMAQKKIGSQMNVETDAVKTFEKRFQDYSFEDVPFYDKSSQIFTSQGAEIERAFEQAEQNQQSTDSSQQQQGQKPAQQGQQGAGGGADSGLGPEDMTKNYEQLFDAAVRQSREFLDRRVARPGAPSSVYGQVNRKRAQEIAFANYMKANFIMKAESGLVGYLYRLATKAPARGLRENLQAAIYAELMRSRQIVLETAVVEARIRQAARESLFQ